MRRLPSSEVVSRVMPLDPGSPAIEGRYPFSPALVQALIAASSVLQRERTALKLMLIEPRVQAMIATSGADLRIGRERAYGIRAPGCPPPRSCRGWAD